MKKNKYKVTRKDIENSPINYSFTEVAIKNVANRKSAYNINELQQENKQLKEQLAIREKNIIEFINELAWFDAQYDAMQSTMGDMPASRSAIPKYAKRYFNLWKELFNENLEQAKEA